MNDDPRTLRSFSFGVEFTVDGVGPFYCATSGLKFPNEMSIREIFDRIWQIAHSQVVGKAWELKSEYINLKEHPKPLLGKATVPQVFSMPRFAMQNLEIRTYFNLGVAE